MIYLYSSDDHFAFITHRIEAMKHSHIMIQISIALDQDFEVVINDESVVCQGVLINSKVEHVFHGKNQRQFFCLIDPTSSLGESITNQYLDESSYIILPESLIKEIVRHLESYHWPIRHESEYISFNTILFDLLNVQPAKPKRSSPIIKKTMKEIMTAKAPFPTMQTLADQASLSQSRLSHLFKEESGLSLYSFLMMNKVRTVIFFVLTGQSISDASVAVGFDSASHFASVCKKMFGMSLRSFSKDSVFLKVSKYEIE